MPAVHRTGALLLACLAPAAAAAAARPGGSLLWSSLDGPTMPLLWQHVASVPVAVLGAAVLGVAVARLLPWPGLPLVVMVGLVAFNALVSERPRLPGLLRRLRRLDRHRTRRDPGDDAGVAVLAPGLPGGAVRAGRLRRVAARRPPLVAAVLSGAALGALVLVAGTLQLP